MKNKLVLDQPLTKEERLLIHHEGLRTKPYLCSAGKLTIGVGRNLEANGISVDEAIGLMRNDLARCRGDLDKSGLGNDLSLVRQTVLRNMLFNLGLTRFFQFEKMLVAVRAKDWERGAAEMLNSEWARQVGDRATRLAEMMRQDRFLD